ncbi:MAG TPA: MBL fold metallo-hydrolase [Propionibacteriaceae bacterium]|nr:MBL fold metallo-hydrolase [Propionibacteriaceae bacterium]
MDDAFHVTPGGGSVLIELPRLHLRKASVGGMDNNAYLLTDLATGQQCLVDAASDAPRLARLVDEGTGRLDLLVTTHRHHDHVGALAAMASRPGVVTAAGEADADALPVAPDRVLRHGDTLRLGESVFQVIGLRGHTPGGVALAYTCPASGVTHLLTGDSLFPGGVGNTRNPGQDFAQLIDDVERRVFDVYEDAVVHPGHGDSTTLAAERPHLPEWRARGW